MLDPHALTLRQWYEQHFQRLFHADAAPGTIESYQMTLSAWERITTNPAIAKIDPLTLADFRAGFLNKNTAAKNCRQLNAMLAKLSPPGPRNRDALGILPNSPWVRPPRAQQRLPFVPADAQLSAMLDGPADLALFTITAALTGSRATAIRNLTPRAIDFHEQVIRFPAATDKCRQDRLKPVPQTLLDWWRQYPDAHKRWNCTRSNFQRRWNRWTAKLEARPLKPHDLKRWWGAQLIRAGATPWAVRYALDHAQTDVTGIHYLAPFDELAGIVNRISLPAPFQITEETCPQPRSS